MSTTSPSHPTHCATSGRRPRAGFVVAALLALTVGLHFAFEALACQWNPLTGELESIPVPITTTTTAVHTSVGSDSVQLVTRLDRTAVVQGGDGLVRMELTLTAAESDAVVAGPVPTDFIVILDRSGSMQGQKLAYAHSATRELIERLRSEDRFALVAYSSNSETAIPLEAATDPARVRWLRRLADIGATGGTNMSSGLDRGIALLGSRAASGRAQRLILLSDGLANEGDSSLEGLTARARGVSAREATVSTVGIGEAFNEQLMAAIADAGTGNYDYLVDGSELARVLDRELNATRATIAQGLTVSFTPGTGVTVVDAGGYPLVANGHQVDLAIGPMFAGQTRKLWVSYRVPSGAVAEHGLGGLSARWTENDVAQTAALTLPKVGCVADEATFVAALDKDAWADAVVTDAYNALQIEVADCVRRGDKPAAAAAISNYTADNARLNAQVQSAVVADNLREVKKLESEVDDAFEGADQRAKQVRLGKDKQVAGRDGMRAGAKYASGSY